MINRGRGGHVCTVEAAPAVLVVNVLREAVLLEQLVRWVLELGEGLRRAADVTQDRGALWWAGVRAEGGGGWRRRIESENNHKNKQNVPQMFFFIWYVPCFYILSEFSSKRRKLMVPKILSCNIQQLISVLVESRGRVQSGESHLTEAVRERCSLESITQPTWHSMGGLELCRVFLFLGVWRVTEQM